MVGSPSRTPDIRDKDGDVRLREAQERCRQLEDEVEHLKVRLDGQSHLSNGRESADIASLQDQINTLLGRLFRGR